MIHLILKKGNEDENFSERMFTYGYRIYDKYQQPIVSCAILTDDNKKWRPSSFRIGLAGSYLGSEFLTIKVIEYENKRLELESSLNPFASVLLTQLTALQTKRKSNDQRKQIKFTLTKRCMKRVLIKKLFLISINLLTG